MASDEAQADKNSRIELNTDILVAGGGAAGVPCALAAARTGARVILVQDRPVLGGNASSEVRMHIVGANGTGKFDRGVEGETEARESGIIEEIRLENAVRNPQGSASMFDLILYDLCRREPNLTLMLNTSVTGAEMETGKQKIVSALADRPSTEERFRISASTFIDCTGDGRLGFEAGAPFMEGRESRAQYGESLAPPEADAKRLGSTILLTARKHDRPMPFRAPEWVRPFSREDLKLRLYATPGEEAPTHEYGYWWAEWGGTLDTIRDNETIRDELLAIALGIWDHVKNGPPEERASSDAGENGDPFDASHWALDWVGFLPGKRESRRFIGQHVLTELDLKTSRDFPDAIAYGGWSIDLHPPEGVDAPDKEPCEQHPVPRLYDIPLRCCVSREVENLMFAGRNLSATHVAFASTRVMATCAVVGQGVGTAAALGIKEKVSPSVMAENVGFIDTLHRQLLGDDAYLIGRTGLCRCPLAASAIVTASSEVKGSGVRNVVSGQTRSVHGPRGVAPDRARRGTHRWKSEELPAWIRFDWDEPVTLSGIAMVFDTGLHRHLTLSHHDGYTAAKMLWGQPQPETVKAYRIEGLPEGGEEEDGSWLLLAEERDNYLRLCRHSFFPETGEGMTPEDVPRFRAIRIVVESAHGIDHARICEIRFIS